MPRLDGREVAAIFVGGCVGAVGRAGLAEAAASAPGHWSWPTFAVNLAPGSLLLGYLVTACQNASRCRPTGGPCWAPGCAGP